MVLPLIKVFSLALRVFTRPLVNYAKAVHKNNGGKYKHTFTRNIFIKLGKI